MNQIEDSNKHQEASPAGQPKKRRGWLVALLVVVIAACLVGAGYGIAQMLDTTQQIQDAQNSENIEPAIPEESSSASAASSSSAAEKELADNPVDFDQLAAQNPDIYAWLYVPGTKVNHAVLQHGSDNAFYLGHDENGDASDLGAIFTEDYNTTDFQDAVTVVYGHNSWGQAMFSTLHFFEDADFFNENEKFYIYTPGHIYTYRVVSAFVADDRHLLYRYGYFQTFDQLRQFESDILEPRSIQQNVRDAQLGDASKIVVLSTCNSGAIEPTTRYLVCGVMVDDQATK